MVDDCDWEVEEVFEWAMKICWLALLFTQLRAFRVTAL
jgi:hypothetical protein